MADDIFGLGTIFEAFEKGTKEVRELTKMYYEPIAKAKGELKASRIRMEGAVQLIKTVEEADRQLQAAGITKRVLNRKLVIPLLEHASLETEEELTTKWAGLLASSVSGSSVHVSFSGILADLTSTEVKILDTLYRWAMVWERAGNWQQSEHTMTKLRDLLGFSKEEFRVPAENLIRLQLCWVDSAWSFSDDAAFDRDSEVHLLLTAFGKAFVAACSGPSKITATS